jgi:S1-C subfamily serine protease
MSESGDPLRRSVVKIFTVIHKPSHYQPWSFEHQRPSGGSGLVLEGNRILTNAHVVAHAVYVQVLKTGDTRKVTARVELIDHDRELATLRVDEEGFFDDTTPVRFGDLPIRQDTVAVYGFPIGGNELSVTEGVVSRIEVRRYTHAHRDLLAIQTDAAINPGNSGGPVFKEGRLVGVVFQAYRNATAERTGYVIPTCIVDQFLKDTDDGCCSGVPSLGLFWQKMENAALRELYRVADGEGVLVTRVIDGGSAHAELQPGDVLTKIDGVKVASDGSVPLRGDDRVNFRHLVSCHQVGDVIDVEIQRQGERHTFPLTLAPPSELVPRPRYVPSTYFIYAGLVLVPLTHDYLSAWSNWNEIDPRFRHYCANELPSSERRQIVLINQVLAHEINVGYHQMRGVIVERVNGMRIRELRDVIPAFAKPKDGFHIIEVDNHAGFGESVDYYSAFGTTIVLRADGAEAANRELLARYKIQSDRSADLEGS